MRRLALPASVTLTAALALAVTVAEGASKQEAAARNYRAANQLYEDLKLVPPLELGIEQYELVASRLQAVRLADPTSGYCDDALLRLGDVYQRMADRFGGPAHAKDAVEAYQTLAREYPHSKLRGTALELAAKLGGNSPASQPPAVVPEVAEVPTAEVAETPTAEVAEASPWPRLALSPDVHAAGSAISPPGPRSAEPDASGSRALVSELRHHTYEDGTRIVVHVSSQRPLAYERQGRGRQLSIDILGSTISDGSLDGKRFKIDSDDQLLGAVRLARNGRVNTRIRLETRSDVTFDAFWLDAPGRLVIDVRSTDQPRAARTLEGLSPPPDPSAVPPKPPTTTASGNLSLTRAMGLKLERILIDAGHGAHDTGSVGPRGLKEKDVVLDIALRLGRIVEDRLGVEVVQTRIDDTFVELEERALIANRSGADLFISIHCNSARSSAVRGVETYYRSLRPSDEWAMAVASLENASSKGLIRNLSVELSRMARADGVEESKDLATKLQRRLHAGLSKHSSNIRNRGVRRAPFVVLKDARVPAALVEVGFLTNRYDEALMRKPTFRQEIAEYLLQGIRDYADSLGMVTGIRRTTSATVNQD